MKMSSSSSCLLFLTAITYTLILLSPPAHANKPSRPFKSIYAFGDSYTDTGNTRSETGPSGFMFVSNLPYGRTFFRHPTNRYSDGRLVIDFMANALSLPFLPPYLDPKADRSDGVNFAVAGSTAIIHSFFVRNNMTLNITPQSLQTQLGWFENFLKEKGCRDLETTPGRCKSVFGDALIWLGEIGVNDYAYSVGSSVSRKTIEQLAIKSITSFIQAILEKGAKYIVVQGVPPTGCLTLSLLLTPAEDRDAFGCSATVNNQSSVHNTALKNQLTIFRKKFPQTTIVYADYYNAYLSVIKNAKTYKLKEFYKACCGYGGGEYNFDYFNACGSPKSTSCSDPSRYIIWDGVHLTEAMYRAVAGAFLHGNYTHPPFGYLLNKKRESG